MIRSVNPQFLLTLMVCCLPFHRALLNGVGHIRSELRSEPIVKELPAEASPLDP